jgi:hypothetical protein
MPRTETFPVPALTAVADKTGLNPLVTVYLSENRNKVIVCPMTSPGKGHYVESAPLSVLPYHADAELLGQAVWNALLAFRTSADLGSSKKTEWPAFKASGAKSVSMFESEYVRVTIEAFPCFLRVESLVPCKSADGLFVGRYISNACEFEELAELIRQTSRCSVFVMEREFS